MSSDSAQHTLFGLYEDSLTDVVLLSQPSQLQNCSIVPPLGNANHHAWHHTQCRLSHKSVTNKLGSVWRYEHADFNTVHALLNLVLTVNINQSWNIWQKKLMEHCIPRGTLPKRHNLPWLNKNILLRLFKRWNCLYRKQKHANDPRLTLKYTRLWNQVTAMMRQAKWSYFRR